MNINMYWPIALIVTSNVCYNIFAKKMPENIDAFASLIITYGVSLLAVIILYFVSNHGVSLAAEYKENLNWVPFAFGLSLIGMEIGSIFFFRAGWSASAGPLINSTITMIAMVFVGWLIFRESISIQKIIGVAVCLVGLFIINKE